MSPADVESPPSRPPRKRRRRQVVCNTCRDRKTRCDGQRPACSSCVRRAVEASCAYEISQDLESSNRRASDMPDAAMPPSSFSPEPHGDGLHAEEVTTLSSSRGETAEPLYVGSSTDALLFRVERAAMSSPNATMGHSDTHGTSSSNAIGPMSATHGIEITREGDISLFVLPPRAMADELVSSYWEFMHPVFPILHKRTFLARYEELWMPSGKSSGLNSLKESIFYATLNIVFALGCRFSTSVPLEKRASYADDFYQRSRKLVNFEILDAMKLSIVQMLLLTGVYLQSTQHATRCWNVVGLAIRAAQSAGLHFKESAVRSHNQLQDETRRRVWYSCVLLDRLLAMTSGYPTMLSGSWNVQVPSIIDDDFMLPEGEGVQPPDVPSRMYLFVYSLRLFEIMDEVLSAFYVPNSGKPLVPSAHRSLAKVLDINSKLDTFRESIPEPLRQRVVTANGHNEPWRNHMKLQSMILYSRFLYVRILLLRTILLAGAEEHTSQVLRQQGDQRLEWKVEVGACNLCVDSAMLLVESLYNNLDTSYRSPRWHTIYFAFASGIVLIAACLSPLVPLTVTDQSFEVSWTKCLAILDHDKADNESARRAIESLLALKIQIENPRRTASSMGAGHSPIPVSTPPDEPLPGAARGGEDQPIINIHQYSSPDGTQQYLNGLNVDGVDLINDAWFTQQIVDLEWLNMPNKQF